jgi:hypothetical protein
MTIIWIFFLTMDTAGTAFLQTLFVLVALLLNRTLKKRDISLGSTISSSQDDNGGEVQVEDSSTGEIEMTDENIEMESSDDGDTEWV